MNKHVTHWRLIWIGFALLIGIGFFSRHALLETLIRGQLHKQGIAVHSLTVEEVSFNALQLRNLSVGTERELQIDEMRIAWRFSDLLARTVKSVEINGLQVVVDLQGELPPLGSLQPLISSSEKNTGSRKLPAISIADSAIQIQSTWGAIAIKLAGNIEQPFRGAQAAHFDAKIISSLGQVTSTLAATLDNTGNIQGEMTVSGDKLELPEARIMHLTGGAVFKLTPSHLHRIDAELALSDMRLSVRQTAIPAFDYHFEQANIQIGFDETHARLTGALRTTHDSFTVEWKGAVHHALKVPDFDFSLQARGAAHDFPWQLLGFSQPDKGRMALTVTAQGQSPAFQAINRNSPINRSWLQQSLWDGQAQLELQGIRFPQKITDLNSQFNLHLALANGVGRLSFIDKNVLQIARLNTEWLTDLGLTTESAHLLSEGGSLLISGPNDQPPQINLIQHEDTIDVNGAIAVILASKHAQAAIGTSVEVTLDNQNKLTRFKLADLSLQAEGVRYAGMSIERLKLIGDIQGSAESGSGQLELLAHSNRLVAGPITARRTSASLPLQISFDQDSLRINLQKAGKVSVGAIDPIDTLRIQDTLNVSIPRMDIELKQHPQGMRFDHHIVAAPAPLTLRIAQQKKDEIEARVHPGKVELRGQYRVGSPYQGKGILRGANLTLAQPAIHLENIATTLHLGATGTGKFIDFTIGQVRHQADTPFFTPISISGHVQPAHGQPDRLTLSVTGGTPALRYLTLSGVYTPNSGKGSLQMEIIPLEFSPGSLQPEVLLPALAGLEDASGTVSASARVNWNRDEIYSSGTLDFHHLSFVYEGVQITDLNATLNLSDVISPASASQQIITIRRIDPGIALESLAVSYRIEGTPPKIALEKASLFLLGGIISLEPTVIDPFATRNDIVVRVDNIDLESFFDLIQVEGLTGNGRLDGVIPICFEGDQMTIRDSHLMAEIPGMLHFKSAKASQLLAGAGEEMDLLLQAMQDFHYTELTLKLSKSAKHDLLATLSLLGNNPNVVDGQMFRLNINLESNIGKILDSISQGYRLSNEVMRGLFRLR